MAEVDASRNSWRQETPGPVGWAKSVRPGDPNKLLMISSDCHANEPARYLGDYIEKEYVHRIPRLEVREDGSEWAVNEGARPQLIKPSRDAMARAKGDDRFFGLRMEPEDVLRNASGSHDRGPPRRSGSGRHRHRTDLPEQGPDVLGDAGSGVRRRDVPRVEPLGLRLPWRRRRLERRAYPSAGVRSRPATSSARCGLSGGQQSTGSSGCASATPRSTGRRCGATSSTTTRRSRCSGRRSKRQGCR